MKNDDIINAIGNLDDSTIEEVNKTRKNNKSKKGVWIKVVAVAASVCLVISGAWLGFDFFGNQKITAYAIEKAVYPEVPQYPKAINDLTAVVFDNQYDEWWKSLLERKKLIDGRERSLDSFIYSTAPAFMANDEVKSKNVIYSPVNVFMALSLLSESTGGSSRQQLLRLTGMKDIETLRKTADAIWNSSYRDDGSATALISNSVWLADDFKYNEKTLKALADNYYASSYSGKMGSEEYNKMLQSWLNEQTDGLLKDSADNQSFDPTTVLGLASTVYFSAKWSSKFSDSLNTEKVFHGADGDKKTEFMNQKDEAKYYYSDRFAAYFKNFENEAGNICFILPDEGVEVSELFNDESALKLMSGEKMPDSKFLNINFSVPKFDIDSDIDLCENLKPLGVTDVFDGEKSDFSPMFETSGAFVNKIDHAARVMIDEDGCKAAAFTVLSACGAMMPPDEEVDFVLDRPFIFVINGTNNLPLFIGVVNNV